MNINVIEFREMIKMLTIPKDTLSPHKLNKDNIMTFFNPIQKRLYFSTKISIKAIAHGPV